MLVPLITGLVVSSALLLYFLPKRTYLMNSICLASIAVFTTLIF